MPIVGFRRGKISPVWLPPPSQVVKQRISLLRSTQVLHENKAGHDVTVFRGGFAFGNTLFVKPARHAVQCFIGQIIRRGTILAVEIRDQTAPNLEVRLPARVRPFAEPIQQPAESTRRKRPVFFVLDVLHKKFSQNSVERPDS